MESAAVGCSKYRYNTLGVCSFLKFSFLSYLCNMEDMKVSVASPHFFCIFF